MAALLWIVAASIVGSVIYLSALERVRDFAVFKATGTSTIAILGGLAFQALVVSIAAAIVGIVLGLLLAPFFPMPVEIPARAYVLLPAVAIVVGLVASLAGLRRAVSVDPALAFGQGDRAELIYVVEDGEIEILREPLDGSRDGIRTVPKGRYFGEIGPIIGIPRSATARALGITRVTGYTVPDFRDHIGAQDLAALVAHDHNPWQDMASKQDTHWPE